MTIKARTFSLLATCICALSTASPAQTPMSAHGANAATRDAADSHAPSTPHLSLGIDANGNGLFDEVEQFTSLTGDAPAESLNPSRTNVERQLEVALRDSHVYRPPPRRRTCFDYLMLDSKDREKADRRLQARTHGVFGSHPCDPVVSTTQERPFDTDFIEVPLIPGTASIKVPGEATGKK